MTEKRIYKSILITLLIVAALLRLASCCKYFFIDEIYILRNLNKFANDKTIVPSDFCYPTLFSYLSFIPTMVGTNVLYQLDMLPSPTAIMVMNDLDSILPILPARLTSTIFALATIFLLFKIGEKYFDRMTGLTAAAIITFSLLHITYSGYAKLDVTMTFFVALTLYFSLAALKSGTTRDYILAGAAAGLTVTTKYNGALVLLPIITAYIFHLHAEKRLSSLSSWFDKRVLLSIIAFTAMFFIGSPTWLIDPIRTWYSLRYMLGYNTTGYIGPFGSSYLKLLALFWSSEKTFALLFALGVAYAVKQRKKQDLLLLSFIVPSVLFIGNFQKISLHYLLFIFPALALLTGRLVANTVSRLNNVHVSLALIVIVSAWPVYSSIVYARQQTREDNRRAAYRWIQNNVPQGSTFIMDKGYLPKILTPFQKYSLLKGKYKDFFGRRLKNTPVFVLASIRYSSEWLTRIQADYLITSSYLFNRFLNIPLPPPGHPLFKNYRNKQALYRQLFGGGPESAWVKVKQFHTGNGPSIVLFKKKN